jgi:hypothetical protein
MTGLLGVNNETDSGRRGEVIFRASECKRLASDPAGR